jgi:UDP-2,3-diacylglucosamine pyrophosphatase LpxH
MALDKDQTWSQLSALWASDALLELETKGQKYAIISDTHMGDGGGADDFNRNEQALLKALDYYFEEGHTLILLGDIEEFWQFDLGAIVDRYNFTVYRRIRQFGSERIHRIFGNHDYEWGGYRDPTRARARVRGIAEEALKLKDDQGQVRLLLVHGHQGSLDADKYSWFSRFFVRLFKGFEPLAALTGLYGHKSATKSQVAKDYERTFYSWAKENKVLVVCGHSHRAIFASKSHAESIQEQIAALEAEVSLRGTWRTTRRAKLVEIARLEREWEDEEKKGRVIEPTEKKGDPLPCYFNSGCGLYSDGLTAIEIEGDTIRLVKWNNATLATDARDEFDSGSLREFIERVVS